jgi:hypothetical protein
MYLMDHIDDLISAEIPDPSIPKNQTYTIMLLSI